MQLDGTVVVVTGGASGLGAGTVDFLRAGGARVASFDMQQPPNAEADEQVRHYWVDVSDEHSVVEALDAVEADFGTVHAVVNCAGIAGSRPLLGSAGRFPSELFNRTLAVNLTGTFLVMSHAAERIAQNEPTADGERGAIINVASIAALDAGSSVGYAASKGGVVSMTLTAARDLSAYGIRVNAIAPGYMDTAMFAGLDDTYKAKLSSGTVFPQRLGDPREFGSLAAHLIENTYINGATMRFDAGARV
ncbi:MAG: SDR family oxidoreductase [Actinomycetia bacterium]|nr:SDR family oxidoreductase [Actinomycetes bacterium]